MPIEIMELVVKANLKEKPSSTGNATAVQASSPSLKDKKDLVEEIVEQVLAIIRQKEER
ncbi:MAG: DUF5908 family protein [Bacteroidia bacterium]|nr:DUF5908 family protein [Bacteroidia bacterium]